MIHVVQIVHILQTQPVGLQVLVLTQMNTLRYGIQLVQCFLLQVITRIDAQVFSLTAPSQRIRTRQHILSRQFLGSLARCHESHLTLQSVVRQCFQEIKDTASGVLTDTEGLRSDPYIDDILTFRKCLQLVRVFLCVDREITPSRIREMETQFVAQTRVTKQHFHLRRTCRLIHLVRSLPTQNVLGTFRQNHLVTHLIQIISRLVGVQQLGVPYALCLHAQNRF